MSVQKFVIIETNGNAHLEVIATRVIDVIQGVATRVIVVMQGLPISPGLQLHAEILLIGIDSRVSEDLESVKEAFHLRVCTLK